MQDKRYLQPQRPLPGKPKKERHLPCFVVPPPPHILLTILIIFKAFFPYPKHCMYVFICKYLPIGSAPSSFLLPTELSKYFQENSVSSLESSSRCVTIPSSLFKCTAHCSKSHLAVVGLPGIDLVFSIAAHMVLCVSALSFAVSLEHEY